MTATSRIALLSLACLVDLAVLASPAVACSDMTSGPSLYSESFPANGVVVVLFDYCTQDGCWEPQEKSAIEVVDAASGDVISGDVLYQDVEHQAKLLWKPKAPFTEGSTYEARILGQALTFTASASADLPASAVFVNDERARRATATVEGIECTDVVSLGWTAGCRAVEVANVAPVRERAYIDFVLNTDADTEGFYAYGQFLTRARFYTNDGTVAQQDWTFGQALQHFDDPADEYCYELEVRSLIDDSTATLQKCFSSSALGSVGPFETPRDNTLHHLSSCSGVKDPADLPLLCEALDKACTQRGDPRACSTHMHECSGVIAAASDAGTGESGALDEASAAAGTSESGALDEASAATGEDSSEGASCSVTSPQRRGSCRYVALLAAALLVRLRRRTLGTRTDTA